MKSTKEKALTSLLSLVLLLLVISIAFHMQCCVWAAGMLIVSTALFPSLGSFIHAVWSGFLRNMESAISSLLLGILFIVLVTPLGFCFRLFHRNHFQIRQKGTGWGTASGEFVTKEDMRDPW